MYTFCILKFCFEPLEKNESEAFFNGNYFQNLFGSMDKQAVVDHINMLFLSMENSAVYRRAKKEHEPVATGVVKVQKGDARRRVILASDWIYWKPDMA